LNNIFPKFEHIFTILAGIFLGGFSIHDAFGYIDPGSGSMFIQVILGALVAVGVAIRVYWEKIKFKLFRK